MGNNLSKDMEKQKLSEETEAGARNVIVEKQRKTASGPLREKARTMEKLVAAVGKVIKLKGYGGLNVASVSKMAGLDRKLVYTYFDSLDKLIETYIHQRDFWVNKARDIVEPAFSNLAPLDHQYVASLLQVQFDTVYNDVILQRIMHWGLGDKNKLLREISDSREAVGEQLFKLVDPQFENTSIDIRAMLGVQVAGMYYMALHAKSNGSLFCGIDLNTPEGAERIKASVGKMVELIYSSLDQST